MYMCVISVPAICWHFGKDVDRKNWTHWIDSRFIRPLVSCFTCNGELDDEILVKPTMSLKKIVDCSYCSASTCSLHFSRSATDLGSIWYNSVSVRFFSLFNAFVLHQNWKKIFTLKKLKKKLNFNLNEMKCICYLYFWFEEWIVLEIKSNLWFKKIDSTWYMYHGDFCIKLS